MATAELAIAAGLVVGGIGTIAAAIVMAALGSEIAQRVDQAVQNTNEFCSGYESAVRGEAFAAGWPKVQAAMLASYREEHWFEWKVYGEDGPGYKILKRLLDARRLNF